MLYLVEKPPPSLKAPWRPLRSLSHRPPAMNSEEEVVDEEEEEKYGGQMLGGIQLHSKPGLFFDSSTVQPVPPVEHRRARCRGRKLR